jgi:hypothetical protein
LPAERFYALPRALLTHHPALLEEVAVADLFRLQLQALFFPAEHILEVP